MNEYYIPRLNTGIRYVPPITSVAFPIVSFIKPGKSRGLFGSFMTGWVYMIYPSVCIRLRFCFRLDKDGLFRQSFSSIRVCQLKFTFVSGCFLQIENAAGEHWGSCVYPA